MKNTKRFVVLFSLIFFVAAGLVAVHSKARAMEIKFGHVGGAGFPV